MQSSGFDVHVVLSRLTEKLYQLLSALPMLLIAVLVVWTAWMAGGWLSRRALFNRLVSRNPFLRDLAQTTTRWSALIVGLVIALDLMNATAIVSAILGTAGVVGVALGFAFKSTLENYLAGILMSLRQPFAPNDDVVIGGHRGSVISLTSRATILMTLDGNHLRLPNAFVFSSVMLNYTRNPSRRLEFDVGVGVQEDLLEAMSLGIQTLTGLDGVMLKPPPRAFIESLADSNVQIRYFAWVDQRTHDFLSVRSEAIRTVKLALEAADMDMPEPIYRLQLSQSLSHEVAHLTAPGMLAAPRSNAKAVVPSVATSAGKVRDVVDTTRNTDIHDQIAHERRKIDTEDLLDPSAPKEM